MLTMRVSQNLYLVARWGNEEEGPNGKDTLYLVAATSHLKASEMVDSKLLKHPHQNVCPSSNWICFLGKADEDALIEGILKGPFYDLAGLPGAQTAWSREHNRKRWRSI
jgi:hypothetical protein